MDATGSVGVASVGIQIGIPELLAILAIVLIVGVAVWKLVKLLWVT